MFRIAVSIMAAGALSFAAAGQADRGVRPAEPAGKYMKSVVEQKLASDYDRAWQSLYPPHQRIAGHDAYVGCESLVQAAGTLVGIKVLRVFNERIRVAGVAQKVNTRAVRVWVAVASPLFPDFPVTITQTFHAIAVNRHWTWILSAAQFEYYREGACPYA